MTNQSVQVFPKNSVSSWPQQYPQFWFRQVFDAACPHQLKVRSGSTKSVCKILFMVNIKRITKLNK